MENMESGILSELELKALRESRNKSDEETAKALGLSIEDTRKILESARKKLSISAGTMTIAETVLPRPKAFALDRKLGQPQMGVMKVGSQILEILGKGVYSAPWNSLKELISNSFDACATKVKIEYSSEQSKLIIEDNGLGMDYIDFDEHFTFITQSEKRRRGDFSEIYERPLIGKFGIGFIAVSQLCDEIKVTSAKKGADTYFVATIDFAKLRREEVRDKEFYQVSQFTLTNFEKKDLDEHYTRIELLKLNRAFSDVLNNVIPGRSPYPRLKVASFEDVVQQLCSGDVNNIRMEAGPFWEFLLNLANVIPVEYLDDGPISFPKNIVIGDKYRESYNSAMKIISAMKSQMAKYNFRVFFNGIQLKKPIRFPNEDWLNDYNEQLRVFPVANVIKVNDPTTGRPSTIDYKGYLYYQKTRIVPEELRGLVIRVRNVAIGGPNRDLWGYPYPGDKVYLDQIYGEICVDLGLEDAMNIDRSTFKTTHFEYTAMRDALHKFLHETVFASAKSMWYMRRTSKERNMQNRRLIVRSKAVDNVLGPGYHVQEARLHATTPVQIKSEEKRIYLNVVSPVFWNFKKDDRILLEDVAIALEIAMRLEKDPEKIKEVFWKTLRQLTNYR
jgi:hypothetical protein